MIEISHFSHFTPLSASSIVDEAVARGHSRDRLRWAASPDQFHAMQEYLSVVSPTEILRHESACGRGPVGLFCGIPFSVAESLPPGTVRLEKVTSVEFLVAIKGMPVPGGFLAPLMGQRPDPLSPVKTNE